MDLNKVLIVDDEDMIRTLLRKILQKLDFTICEASNFEEAIEVLNKENINICFLDLNLPEKNGFDLCKEIKEINPVAICYAITGYSSIFDFARSRQAGFDDYFVKPLDVLEISEAAKEARKKIERWSKRN